MKTAIYIEDGVTQLVLTPENDWEKSVVNAVTTGEQKATVLRGSFYECQGGWVRNNDQNPESLIIKTDIKPQQT